MKKIVTGASLFLADFVLLLAASRSQETADFYSRNVYPVFLNTLGRLTGIYPWSAAEMVILAIVGILLMWIGRCVVRYRKKEKGWKLDLIQGSVNLFLASAVFFSLFTLTEGINYYRTSFAAEAGIEEMRYTTEELAEAYQILQDQVNGLAGLVERDEEGIMTVNGKAQEEAVEAMKRLGESCESLGGYYPKPKKVMFSKLLSLENITGIYTPFTMEANYNRDIIGYNQPFTMCHELSHIKGYMQEEEANFIAYLACETSDSNQFQYSGAMMGMIYCGNELYERDPEFYQRIREQTDPRARLDLEKNTEYWDKYDGWTASLSQKVNDVYLKVNRQSEGIESYDKVTDLLVQHLVKQE